MHGWVFGGPASLTSGWNHAPDGAHHRRAGHRSAGHRGALAPTRDSRTTAVSLTLTTPSRTVRASSANSLNGCDDIVERFRPVPPARSGEGRIDGVVLPPVDVLVLRAQPVPGDLAPPPSPGACAHRASLAAYPAPLGAEDDDGEHDEDEELPTIDAQHCGPPELQRRPTDQSVDASRTMVTSSSCCRDAPVRVTLSPTSRARMPDDQGVGLVTGFAVERDDDVARPSGSRLGGWTVRGDRVLGCSAGCRGP